MTTKRDLVYVLFFLMCYVPGVTLLLLLINPVVWGIVVLVCVVFVWLLGVIPATRDLLNELIESDK